MLAGAIRLTAVYAVGNVLQKAGSVILVPLYTAWLSPADYGVFALLTLTGLLINATVGTPITSALNRFYYRPGYREQNDVLVFNLGLVAAGLMAVVACVYWFLTPLVARVVLGDGALLPVARLYTAVLVVSCSSTLLGLLLQLNEAGRRYLAASLINVAVGASVTVVLLTREQLGVTALVGGQIAGHAAFTLVCLPVLLRRACRRTQMSLVRTPLRFGYATLLSGYSMLLMQVGDRFAVRALMSVGDVGLYAFAGTIGQLVTLLFGGPVSSGTSPVIRKLEAEPERQRMFLRRLTTWIWVSGLWVVLALTAFSREIPLLLASNPTFCAAWTVIPIVSLSRLLHLMAGFTGCGITLGDRPGWLSVLVVLGAAVNLALGLLLIPLWGLMGAAVATALCMLLWNAANAWLSRRFYDLRFEWGRVAHAAAIAVCLAAAALAAGAVQNQWWCVGLKTSVLAIYPAGLWMTGFVSESERGRLRSVLQRLRGLPRRGTSRLAGSPVQQ